MKTKTNIVTAIISLATLISICFGTYFFIDNRYALSTEVAQIKARLEYKIVSDQAMSIQERIWVIEDRYRGREMDTTACEELRKLKQQLEDLKQKLNLMEKSK